MRYFYIPERLTQNLYGREEECKHSLFRSCTVFDISSGLGFGVVQRRFDPEAKCWYYSSLDPGLANDIYLNDGFPEYFKKVADRRDDDGDYPIYDVRKVMWALRMKPLRKEEWEKNGV